MDLRLEAVCETGPQSYGNGSVVFVYFQRMERRPNLALALHNRFECSQRLNQTRPESNFGEDEKLEKSGNVTL